MLEPERRTSTAGSAFRSDLQGLRAIAVLAVVLYHAHCPGLTGGFIGVDIFFVLSGYLICGLLSRELAATGRIDLARFLLKRARRLMPNAALVLIAVLFATALLQPGYTFPVVARGVTAAALSFANLHFAARDVDYFADDAHPSPVLHFWSLSVEEQFYLAWPLLLVVLAWSTRRNTARHAISLLGGIWTLSFMAAMIAVRFDQPLAFYHTELRAWQLATGGLVSALAPQLERVPAHWRIAMGWLGLTSLVIDMLKFDQTLAYPGLWALLPTLSTAAVLATPAASASPSSLLSLAPLRWIGDRSYSLYLWHWPALVLMPALLPRSDLAVPAALVLAALAAAIAYQFVEMPIRRMRFGLAPRWPGFAMAAACIGVVLIGSNLLSKPLWHRDQTTVRLERAVKLAALDKGRNVVAGCHRTFAETDQPLCAFGDTAATRTAVLLGDSHASQWFEALDKVAKANGWRLLAWSKSACPIAEVQVWNRLLHSRYSACETWRKSVLARLISIERPQKVFLASFVEFADAVLQPTTGALMPHEAGVSLWRDGFAAIIQQFQSADIEPIVIADTPQAELQFADCLAMGRGPACDRPRAAALPKDRPDVEAATLTGAKVLDLTDRLCGPEICPAMLNGQIVYRDRHHLTARFAASLSDAFERYLPKAGPVDDDIMVSSISPLRP